MRCANINRKTKETDIKININLDGEGNTNINTLVPAFDHMLEQIGKHALLDLNIEAKGDIEIDCHHTVEDVGIALGMALKEALGDLKGINRYGSAIIPMDEVLVMCAIDVSNRPYLEMSEIENIKLGNFDGEMVLEFFRALSINASINIHISVLRGKNMHHIIEGIFKAFARALLDAISINPRIKGILSSKGIL